VCSAACRSGHTQLARQRRRGSRERRRSPTSDVRKSRSIFDDAHSRWLCARPACQCALQRTDTDCGPHAPVPHRQWPNATRPVVSLEKACPHALMHPRSWSQHSTFSTPHNKPRHAADSLKARSCMHVAPKRVGARDERHASHSHVKHGDGVIGEARRHLRALGVPTHLENPSLPAIGLH